MKTGEGVLRNRRICVVIPVLNEEEALPQVLSSIPVWCDEVVVVDNGSTDASAEVAEGLGAKVVRESRRGYGAAMNAGFLSAKDCDVVVFMDGDGSSDPSEMEELVRPILDGKADFVLGSRGGGSIEKGSMSFWQRLGNPACVWLLNFLMGSDFTDLGPFRAVSMDASACLVPLSVGGYGWPVAMQLRAVLCGLKYKEVPVAWRLRCGGRSKISGLFWRSLFVGGSIISTILGSFLKSKFLSIRKVFDPHKVVVFVRYPRPGRVKTRLARGVGDRAAAALYKAMAERTVLCARELKLSLPVDVEIMFEGGSVESMALWLGRGLRYVRQSGEDLGRDMAESFRTSFADGYKRVVLIGSDCPLLDGHILKAAFASLDVHDVVIGPAADGGYYLIGMKRYHPSLFEGIEWGCDEVFEDTKREVRRMGLSLYELPVLSDIDRASDLSVLDERIYCRLYGG